MLMLVCCAAAAVKRSPLWSSVSTQFDIPAFSPLKSHDLALSQVWGAIGSLAVAFQERSRAAW